MATFTVLEDRRVPPPAPDVGRPLQFVDYQCGHSIPVGGDGGRDERLCPSCAEAPVHLAPRVADPESQLRRILSRWRRHDVDNSVEVRMERAHCERDGHESYQEGCGGCILARLRASYATPADARSEKRLHLRAAEAPSVPGWLVLGFIGSVLWFLVGMLVLKWDYQLVSLLAAVVLFAPPVLGDRG
jgi:hypothetical protein